MKSYYELLKVQKENKDGFLFFKNLSSISKNEKFINEFFNLPKLPLIGIKNPNPNSNSHILGKILSMVCFEINICQGENKDKVTQNFTDFILPDNLTQYLNVDEFIEIDNNTYDKENNFFYMPRENLNFYLIISELPNNSSKISDDNDLNTINIIHENNIINEKPNNNYSIYNIIPQFFNINDSGEDIMKVRNLNFNNQITLFSIDSENYSDIMTEHNEEFIDINNLRAENSNIFLNDKNNFILSDNLKFYYDTKKNLSQFYLVNCSIDKDSPHSVFYYITCNNETSKNSMVEILNKAQTLEEFINEMELNFGKCDVVQNLNELFKIKNSKSFI